MPEQRRFPPLWTIEEQKEEPGRRSAAKLLSKDRRDAPRPAKLPELLRKA